MTDRIATYRLQFRDGMTFDSAVEIVPYLARLGVSHLYASPLFAATSGSTHGYDVVDYNRFDATIGGREGFERLSAALQRRGLGADARHRAEPHGRVARERMVARLRRMGRRGGACAALRHRLAAAA